MIKIIIKDDAELSFRRFDPQSSIVYADPIGFIPEPYYNAYSLKSRDLLFYDGIKTIPRGLIDYVTNHDELVDELNKKYPNFEP